MYLIYVQDAIEKSMRSDNFVGSVESFLQGIASHPERALMHQHAMNTMEDMIETTKWAGVIFFGDSRINDSRAARFVRLTSSDPDKSFASEFDVLMRAMEGLRQLGCKVEFARAGAEVRKVESQSPQAWEDESQQKIVDAPPHCHIADVAIERNPETLQAVSPCV